MEAAGIYPGIPDPGRSEAENTGQNISLQEIKTIIVIQNNNSNFLGSQNAPKMLVFGSQSVLYGLFLVRQERFLNGNSMHFD